MLFCEGSGLISPPLLGLVHMLLVIHGRGVRKDRCSAQHVHARSLDVLHILGRNLRAGCYALFTCTAGTADGRV